LRKRVAKRALQQKGYMKSVAENVHRKRLYKGVAGRVVGKSGKKRVA